MIFYCTTGNSYWTDAECIIDSRDRKLSLIITVVYERERCFNWLNSRAPVRSRASKDWTTTREVFCEVLHVYNDYVCVFPLFL